MSSEILTALAAKLSSDVSASSFWTAVGGRVYHLRTPEGTAPPLTLYAISDPAPLDLSFDGQQFEEWRVTFATFVSVTGSANPDTDALSIDSKLRTLLHDSVLTPTGYPRVQVSCETYGNASIDTDSVTVESVYRIFGSRTI